MDMYQKREMRKQRDLQENNDEKKITKVDINWFPGHMTKTLRAIAAELKNVDMVVELLDARLPFSSINPELEKLFQNKKKLYILNKADLADEAATKRWIAACGSLNGSAVAVSAKDKGAKKRIVAAIKSTCGEQKRGKPRAMITGIPNVGKSTLINLLAGTAATKTADKPGVTRGKQWITLPEIELLDMPGVLWPKFESMETALKLAFTGAIKDDIMDIEQVAAVLLDILKQKYRKTLCDRYKLDESKLDIEGHELLELIAKKRGMLISGGETDTLRAAAMLLDELRGGKLGRITFEEPSDYGL